MKASGLKQANNNNRPTLKQDMSGQNDTSPGRRGRRCSAKQMADKKQHFEVPAATGLKADQRYCVSHQPIPCSQTPRPVSPSPQKNNPLLTRLGCIRLFTSQIVPIKKNKYKFKKKKKKNIGVERDSFQQHPRHP